MNSAQVNVEFDEWTMLVEEYRQIKKEATELEQRKVVTQKRLQELCGEEESVQRDGLKVQYVTTRSPVQWRSVPELRNLSEQYLDSFRGDDRAFYKFSFYA